jgi:hypothetical protein
VGVGMKNERFTYEIEIDHTAEYNPFKYDLYRVDLASENREFVGCYLTRTGARRAAHRDVKKQRKRPEVVVRFEL